MFSSANILTWFQNKLKLIGETGNENLGAPRMSKRSSESWSSKTIKAPRQALIQALRLGAPLGQIQKKVWSGNKIQNQILKLIKKVLELQDEAFLTKPKPYNIIEQMGGLTRIFRLMP